MLAGVYSAYPKQGDLSDFMLNLWWESLKSYDYEALADAFTRHWRDPDEGKFLPKAGNIEKLLHGSTLDRGMVAWSKVNQAAQRVGTYESVCFDDPICNAVVLEMGGWIQFGQFMEKDLPFRAKEFVDRYRAVLTRGSLVAYPRECAGILARDNAARGYLSVVGGVQLIGDQEKARKVYEGGGDGLQLTVTPMARAALTAPTGGS